MTEVTKGPCVDCPFRKGVGERMQIHEVKLRDFVERDGLFHCHKTLDLQADDDGVDTYSGVRDDSKICGGWLAVLDRSGKSGANQMVRIIERTEGLPAPDEIDPKSQAYDSLDDLFTAHTGKPYDE